ncbi:MAG: MEDS domain-containing protein [Nitrospiraceae bacterium]
MMSMPHAVQFYQDDVGLIEAVAAFIKAGYEENATIIVVATETHRADLRITFQDSGITGIEDRVRHYDATDLLSAFMVDGWPNHTRFTATVGRIVQQAALAGPVRIFGEMVAVLWAEGQTRAAIRLEELWNELATRHAFSLLCAYPIAGFPDQKADLAILRVCHTHSHVYFPEQPR